MSDPTPDLDINVDAMTRGMAATLFMADALAAASPEQRVLIRQIIAGLERPVAEGGTPMRTVMEQVALAVPGWEPSPETVLWIESILGKPTYRR